MYTLALGPLSPTWGQLFNVNIRHIRLKYSLLVCHALIGPIDSNQTPSHFYMIPNSQKNVVLFERLVTELII